MLIVSAPSIRPAPPAGCQLSFNAAGYQVVAPSAPLSGRRIYLFPGFGSGNEQWSQVPFTTLMADLSAAGHQAVLIPVPIPSVACFFSNGGWQYREQFVAQLNAIMNSVESQYGPAQKNIAGGISFGGLHAMMAMASNGRFASWWAHLPVTFISALTELSGVGNVARFNPTYEVQSLKGTTGFITWGTADTRTNYLFTEALAEELGAGVTKIQYTGQDHSTDAQNISDIIAWINAQ